MAYTVQQVVDHARIPLNDTDKVRYPDSELLSFFNDALLITRKTRPDLFLGLWLSLPENLQLTDTFPISSVYFPYFADYITGRAEVTDDEFVDNSRAMTLIQSFLMGLKTL